MNLDEMLLTSDKGREPNFFEKAKIKISILSRKLSYKLKDTAAVISGKKLKDNKEYEGAPRVSQEMVEENPRKWIIEECVPACKILWDKNIYTFMCSDSIDYDSWIELELDCLSLENMAILEEIKKEYVCYPYHQGCLNISVPGKGKKAQEELIKIAERFKMQDVPSLYATFDMEKVYMINGCSKEIENPSYIPFEEQLANMTFANWGMEFEEPTIWVLDPTKIVKSDQEYIDNIGAIRDEDNGVIYVNQFHYNKYLNYKNSLVSKKTLKYELHPLE